MSSGLDNIVDSILGEGKDEVSKILDDAERQRKVILNGASVRAKEIREKFLKENSRRTQLFEERSDSVAAVRYRDGVLGAKLKILDDVLDSAKDFFSRLPDAEYFFALSRIFSKYFCHGESCSLVFSSRDYSRLTDKFKSMFSDEAANSGTRLEFSADCSGKDYCGAILRYGSFEENCVLDEIFNDKREDLVVFLLDFLFDEVR